MTAARTAPQTHRRPQDEPDDVFVARSLEFTAWARRNKQALVLFGIVLALMVGGIAYYASYRAEMTRQAVLELERIQQTVGVGEVEAARAELTTFIDRFGGTPYAAEARLLLGQLYLESDQPQQASEVLEPAASDLGEPIGIQAAMLLARAAEEAGQPDRAEDLFLDVADRAELDFQVRQALADAARLRASAGDHAGAAELYRRILEGMEEDDPQRGPFEMRLQEVLTEMGT